MIDRVYRLWLGGALTSQLGNAVLFFALGWAASASGGSAAALVLTAVTVPRTVLMLVGGAVGDRLGARPVLIAGDAVMLAVTVALAVAVLAAGTPLALLVAAALVVGVVDAFYLPSSGSMPRRLVDDVHLPRAIALKQSGDQTVAMLGPPIGGALVAGAGLAAAAAVDAVTFAAVLVVLIAIRPRYNQPAAAAEPIRHAIVDGLRVAVRTPTLGPALLLVAAAAGFVLPTASLLVPLLARANGWTAAGAGLVAGAQGLGIVAATLTVARLRRAVVRHGAAANVARPNQRAAAVSPNQPATAAPPNQRENDARPNQPATGARPHQHATDAPPDRAATAPRPNQHATPPRPNQLAADAPPDQPATVTRPNQPTTALRPNQHATDGRPGAGTGGVRPGRAAAGGLLVVVVGQVMLALSADTVALAVAAGATVGVGTGVFAAHLAPLLLGAAPRTHLARVQALVGVVQSAALVVTTNLLGAIATTTSAATALLLCAAGLLWPAWRGLTLDQVETTR